MSPSDDRQVTLIISNSLAELQKVVDFVEKFGTAQNVPQRATNDLNLCLDEVLNNAISYGYEDQSQHTIRVVLSLSEGWLSAEIKDDGKPFDPRVPGAAPVEVTMHTRRIGGLGRTFVKALMDEVDYERDGQYNVLTLKKKLSET